MLIVNLRAKSDWDMTVEVTDIIKEKVFYTSIPGVIMSSLGLQDFRSRLSTSEDLQKFDEAYPEYQIWFIYVVRSLIIHLHWI